MSYNLINIKSLVLFIQAHEKDHNKYKLPAVVAETYIDRD